MGTFPIEAFRKALRTSLFCSPSPWKWAAARQNQQNDLCAQRRPRSAWASARSDQSLRCTLNGWLKTQGFFMPTARTLIRLGECWANRSFCWFLSCCGSLMIIFFICERVHKYREPNCLSPVSAPFEDCHSSFRKTILEASLKVYSVLGEHSVCQSRRA